MITNIDEAIAYCQERAEEQRGKADELYEISPGLYGHDLNLRFECLEYANDQDLIAQMLIELKKRQEADKKGEWIGIKTSCNIGHKFYYCSKCNREIDLIEGESLKDYPFCHCGADMKGGAE